MVTRITMRARRLLDPLNTNEWVEVEVRAEVDRVDWYGRHVPIDTRDIENECRDQLVQALDRTTKRIEARRR